LRNNIYGVDLNEESVEITKLSLWLKTAQKGKKLTTLDENIKCGNSLVDDARIAGDKVFDWQEQFADVFKNGGFDVVVGNPPYVKLQNINSGDVKQTQYFEQSYEVAKGRFDLYVLFIEKALSIIREDGIASYILPHKFLGSEFGNATRKYLANKNAVKRIVHFGSHRVFADASTYTCVIELSKNNKELLFAQVNPLDIQSSIAFSGIEYKNLGEGTWQLVSSSSAGVISKVTSQENKLKDIFSKVSRGVVTGADSIFIVKGKITGSHFIGRSKELNDEITLESELVKPLLMGSSVSRYTSNSNDTFLVYPHELNAGKTAAIDESKLRDNYPLTYAYLSRFREILVAKKIKYKTNPNFWYSLHNSREIGIFENRKIITPYLANYTNMTIEPGAAYTNDKNTNLVFRGSDSKEQNALFAILNSKLVWYYISMTGSEFSGGYFAFTNIYLEPITFPDLSRYKEELNDAISLQFLRKTELINTDNRFRKIIQNEFEKTLPNRWWTLDFTGFVTTLKVKLSLQQKDELLQLFEKYSVEVTECEAELQKTDHSIDQLVYQLYELSKEEIALVEAT
jgi:tRNA1(Val) A37 N6-methylase TrmN6